MTGVSQHICAHGVYSNGIQGGMTPVSVGMTLALKLNQTGNAAAPSGKGGSTGVQVGLDVEEIRALPKAADYWVHEFYQGSFAKSEIAYAVLHAEPRTHFAGFWCVKEALRKCDPSFAGVAPERTAIAHDSEGRPYLTLATDDIAERLPHAVSISHTTDVATAVVVLGTAASEAVVEVIAPVLAEAIVPEKRRSRGLAKLFGV